MGSATVAAEGPLDPKAEDPAPSLNMTTVRSVPDKGTAAATGAGDSGEFQMLDKLII